MGGERFDQSNPESYLFGENSDLNWFATKPTAVRIIVEQKPYVVS